MQPVEDFTTVESLFVRRRNALLLRGQFTPVYTDYYLHLMQHGIRHPPDLDQMLKDALAMLALHLTARPCAESAAWTANLRAPRINLFVTGGSLDEAVVGRIFTEDVREPDRNYFHNQVMVQGNREPSVSSLEIDGRDPVAWISQYYDRSEQRPARAFRLEDENFAIIAAQPDCDLEWLASLDGEEVSRITEDEETSLLETRRFRFNCGCTLERILPILGGWRDKPEQLFGQAEMIQVQCPRCAASYQITRAMLGG
jgi:molecular chaperone Hsp33